MCVHGACVYVCVSMVLVCMYVCVCVCVCMCARVCVSALQNRSLPSLLLPVLMSAVASHVPRLLVIMG